MLFFLTTVSMGNVKQTRNLNFMELAHLIFLKILKEGTFDGVEAQEEPHTPGFNYR